MTAPALPAAGWFTRKINFIDFACARQSSGKPDSALTYRKIGFRSAIPKAFGTKLASTVLLFETFEQVQTKTIFNAAL